MSNTLLESLWARVTANIGDRIDQISELLTQALSASAESKAARDAAAGSATEAASHADRAEQATDITGLRNEVTQQIAAVVDGSPAALDTIREVAEYAQANRGITDQLNAAIGDKANKSHTHTTSHISDYPGHVVFIGSDSYGKIPVREPDSDNLRTGNSPTEPYHVTSKQYVDKEVAKKANTSHTHTQAQVTGLSTALDGKADKSYVDARPAIFTVPDINSASTENLVPGDVVVDTSTWIFYYLE